jgi:hypothetical protein
MSSRFALRLVVGLLVLAMLACNPVPNVNIPIVSTVQAAASQVGTLQALGTAVGTLQAVGTALATISSSYITAQATFAAATPAPTAVVPPDSLLPARLKAGQLKLDSITVDSNGADFYGPILSVQVTNPGSQDVLTTIPCGLIFVPDDNSQQRLMVLQPISAVVAAKSPAVLKPFVDCIDDSKHAPANASTYQLGTMASGDLLKLAACACTQPLSINADLNREFGLQVAVWHTSDPKFPSEITTSLIGPALQPLMPLFLASANAWLTKCGLNTIK